MLVPYGTTRRPILVPASPPVRWLVVRHVKRAERGVVINTYVCNMGYQFTEGWEWEGADDPYAMPYTRAYALSMPLRQEQKNLMHSIIGSVLNSVSIRNFEFWHKYKQ